MGSGRRGTLQISSCSNARYRWGDLILGTRWLGSPRSLLPEVGMSAESLAPAFSPSLIAQVTLPACVRRPPYRRAGGDSSRAFSAVGEPFDLAQNAGRRSSPLLPLGSVL